MALEHASHSPQISVVVPVYNSQDYLQECLDSLLAQTLRDVEIVCIDDGSTDASPEILAAAAAADARICAITQENRGVSAARNTGIARARAPYLCFVDADDALKPHACERMVDELSRSQADVLVFGAQAVPEEQAPAWLRMVLSPRNAEYARFHPDILFKEQSRPYVWKTAYRTKFLHENQIAFNESLAIGEDQAFLFDAFPCARKTVFVSDKLYRYRIPLGNSAMARVDDAGTLLEKQIELARAVFASWEARGMLARYASEMLDWFADMAVFETLKLDDASFAKLAAQEGDVLRSFWTPKQLDALSLPRPLRGMCEAALDPARAGSASKRKRLMIRYYVWKNGLGAVFKRLLRG